MLRVACALCLVLVLAGVAPAAAADYPPGIMYSTLLDGVGLLSNNGQIRLESIQAVFLPDPNNNEYNPYNPNKGAALWAILSSGGKEIYRFDFYAEKLKAPYWLLSAYDTTNLATGENIGGGFVELGQTGQYVLDFYLDSGKFYTYSFAISVLKSDDPFAGSDQWVLDGPWEDWAYFYYRDADPEQNLYWKMWLRQREFGPEKSCEPWMEIRDSSGNVVCNSRESWSINLHPDWIRYETDMVTPKGQESYGQYFKAKDLLAKDGTYTMTVKLDGKLYGTWKFEIKDGKFVYTGRTVRGQGDPLAFIEGGRDAFWYERQ